MVDVVSSCLSLIGEIHSLRVAYDDNKEHHAKIRENIEWLNKFFESSLTSPLSESTQQALEKLKSCMEKFKLLCERQNRGWGIFRGAQEIALAKFTARDLEEISQGLENGKNILNLALTAHIRENLGIVKNIIEDRFDNVEETLIRKTKLDALQVPLENITIFENLKIGEGGFGSVVVAKWKGRDVAIKRLTCDTTTLNDVNRFRDIENEVLVMNVLASEI